MFLNKINGHWSINRVVFPSINKPRLYELLRVFQESSDWNWILLFSRHMNHVNVM